MRLYSLTSSLHSEFVAPSSEELFIQNIEAQLGERFTYCEDDFSGFGEQPDDLLYVRSGGTEGFFKAIWSPGNKHVRLLTSGQSNSLAASMEIVSFLRQNGASGRIFHGSAADIAAALRSSEAASKVDCLRELAPTRALEGVRLGIVGRPSDWLISSDVDSVKAAQKLGAQLIDIPMEEMLAEYEKGTSVLLETMELKPITPCRYGKQIGQKDMDQSLRVYGALKRIVRKYELDGLSLRCFDLLTAIGTTGCMALAILNSEGVTATCEGDVPTMLTMELAKRLCGTSGFQVNLSKIENGTALFAHCTVPLNIVRDYCYDTHFESGIGVAVHGEFEPGAATIVKIGSSLDEFMAEDVRLEANSYGDNLCRTQVLIRGSRGEAFPLSDYFLTSSLGNHHVIVPGAHAKKFKDALAK